MLIPSIVGAGLDPKEVANQAIKQNYNSDEDGEKKAWKGIWSAGQGVGSVASC